MTEDVRWAPQSFMISVSQEDIENRRELKAEVYTQTFPTE
jgi:hypothetical protein